MGSLVRRGMVGILLALVIACSGNTPTSPTTPSPNSQLPPASSSDSPAPPGARVFVYDGPLTYANEPYTVASRYVLLERTFEVQYATLGLSYSGSYTAQGTTLTLQFSGDQRWGATATLSNDRLEVRYNDIMGLSGFDDAAYRRVQ